MRDRTNYGQVLKTDYTHELDLQLISHNLVFYFYFFKRTIYKLPTQKN